LPTVQHTINIHAMMQYAELSVDRFQLYRVLLKSVFLLGKAV